MDNNTAPTAAQEKALLTLTTAVTPEGVPTSILERPDLEPMWWWETEWGANGNTRRALVERNWVEHSPLKGYHITPAGVDAIRVACRACGHHRVDTLGHCHWCGMEQEKCCRVCGHWVDDAGKCRYCGAIQGDYRFLDALGPIPDDILKEHRIVLHCCYTTGPDHKRCTGEMPFTLASLRETYNVGGNGPNTYMLGCRFGLQARCPVCDTYNGAWELLRGNAETLRAAIAKVVPVQSVNAPVAGTEAP